MAKDYYQILGVDKKASKDEIKKAFYKLAHKYHPDKAGGNEAKFKEVNEAYQILSDDGKRAKYDQFGAGFENMQGGFGGQYQQGGFGGFDFSGFGQGGIDFDLNDIFSDFFTGGMGGGTRAERRQGRDIQTEIQISLTDALLGMKRKIILTKTSKCETCSGSGAKPGTKIQTCKKCGGQGRVHEAKRTILGTISSTKLCEECSGSGEVPTEKCEKCRGMGVLRKENEISIEVPAGIRDGQTLKIAGQGEAVKNGRTGDLYINVRIKIPSKISKRARELLEELKKEGI